MNNKSNVTPNQSFETRRSFFINTLRGEKGTYRISDSKSLNLFNSNIDIILSILTLNFECTCNDETINEEEKTFKYEIDTKNRVLVVKTKTISCKKLDI